MVWVNNISSFINQLKFTQTVNISNILWKSSRFLGTVGIQSSSSSQDAGGYSIGESIQPIKMAYASYESTKPSLSNAGAPIIIMHGLMGSKGNWNSLSKAIHSRTKLKVLAVDARNHGDSAHTEEMSYPHLAEDIRALMHDLRIKKATLLGHSMGGRAMMLMALRYPELVDKLIIVDISPIGSSPSLFLMPKFFDAMDNVRLEAHIPMSAARDSADKQLSATISDKGIRQFILTNLVVAEDGRYKWRLNLSALAKTFTNIANFPTIVTSFDKPTLFIAGGNSDYIKKVNHVDIKKLFPQAIIETIPNTGHWVHSEKPNEFVNLVAEFLMKPKSLQV